MLLLLHEVRKSLWLLLLLLLRLLLWDGHLRVVLLMYVQQCRLLHGEVQACLEIHEQHLLLRDHLGVRAFFHAEEPLNGVDVDGVVEHVLPIGDVFLLEGHRDFGVRVKRVRLWESVVHVFFFFFF